MRLDVDKLTEIEACRKGDTFPFAGKMYQLTENPAVMTERSHKYFAVEFKEVPNKNDTNS